MEAAQVFDPSVHEFRVEFLHVFRFGGEGHHPFLESALADAVEQFVGRTKGGDDGLVGVLIESLGFQVVVFEGGGVHAWCSPSGEVGVQGTGVFLEAVEVESGARHGGDDLVAAFQNETTLAIGLRVETAGDLRAQAVGKGDGLPVLIADAEGHRGPVQSHAVRSEAVGHVLPDVRKHLIGVEDARRPRVAQAEAFAQFHISPD